MLCGYIDAELCCAFVNVLNWNGPHLFLILHKRPNFFFPTVYILFDMHLLENRIYITNSPAIMDMRTFVAKCVIL